jgi:hypothetical protein
MKKQRRRRQKSCKLRRITPLQPLFILKFRTKIYVKLIMIIIIINFHHLSTLITYHKKTFEIICIFIKTNYSGSEMFMLILFIHRMTKNNFL